jgi:hypothetical protein
MGKVALFSALLIAGLLGSQLLPGFAVDPVPALQEIVRLLTMLCLGFIMIHVGYEFEIDRANIGAYAVDYGVAATAAAFPWIFCAIYFVFVLDSGPVGEVDTWRDALLTSRFAAPTRPASVLDARRRRAVGELCSPRRVCWRSSTISTPCC